MGPLKSDIKFLIMGPRLDTQKKLITF